MTNVVDEAYESAVRTFGDAITKIETTWEAFKITVKAAIEKLVQPLEAMALNLFAKVATKMTELILAVKKLWLDRGSASALREAASKWNDQIGNVISTLSSDGKLGQLSSTGYWSGVAASKYQRVTFDQNAALKAFNDSMTTPVHDFLQGVADAIKSFWVHMATAIGICVAAIIGATAIASPIGGLVAVLAAAVALFADVAINMTDLENTLDSKKGELERAVSTDNTTFANRKWPAATGATAADRETFGDASVLDGDRSEWTPV